jgi:hypothetical protein
MLKIATVTATPIAVPFAVRRRNQAANGWVDGFAVAYDESRDIFIVDHGTRGKCAAYGCDVEAA